MAYRLQDEPGSSAGGPDEEIRRWKELLQRGTPAEQRTAVSKLMELRAESALVECLQSANALAVGLATGGLWECWMNEEGPAARHELDRGLRQMDEGDLAGALETFGKLVEAHPQWAEAHNKQATVLYRLGNARLSYRVCRVVVELKPHHFGAWNGLALCAAQLEKWRDVLEAAREALRLQPSAFANLDLIRLAEARLAEE